jgi:hypothetical protein
MVLITNERLQKTRTWVRCCSYESAERVVNSGKTPKGRCFTLTIVILSTLAVILIAARSYPTTNLALAMVDPAPQPQTEVQTAVYTKTKPATRIA